MLKRKRFLKQSLAVLLSLTMSLGPCAPASFAAPAGEAGVEASVDAGSEAGTEESSGEEAGTEEASGAEEANSESEEAGASGKAEKALDGVMQLVLDARKKAREEKNWAESDRIRDTLASFGIAVKDTKDGATWTLE